jgi:hypothetical protein
VRIPQRDDRELRRGYGARLRHQRNRALLAPAPAGAHQPVADHAHQMGRRRCAHGRADCADARSCGQAVGITAPYPAVL